VTVPVERIALCGERADTPDNLLSVVIIARNEAQNIKRCIESVLAETFCFSGTGVVLVDSCSTDGTIDIVREFPVNIIQLQSHWPMTPGAGRYLGTLATSSQYILFLDGDTVLSPGWLSPALDFLCQHPKAAGVGGILDEFYVDEQSHLVGKVVHRYQGHTVHTVRTLGGNGLYRRVALDEVGTFHPYLAWREEAEVALRLRKAGYTLWRLPLPMAQHFSRPRGTLRETIRRFKVGYYPKSGRTLRAAYKQGLAGQFIREFLMSYVATGSYLLLGLVAFIVMLAGQCEWLIAWLIGSVAIFMVYSVRKRSLLQAFNKLLARLMIVYGLIVGFIAGGQDAGQYPTDVIILQRSDSKKEARDSLASVAIVEM